MKKIYFKPETQQTTMVGVLGICQATVGGGSSQPPAQGGPSGKPGGMPGKLF